MTEFEPIPLTETQMAELFRLRQRVQELTAERDKATQYLQIAEGRCDALKQQMDELLQALETIVKDDSHNPSLMVMIAAEAIASVKEKA